MTVEQSHGISSRKSKMGMRLLRRRPRNVGGWQEALVTTSSTSAGPMAAGLS